MDWTFNGLPLHILVVHFVVIVVPLAALCVVLTAAWPAARRRLGIATPLVALAALVSVPIATEAGEWLEERVHESSLSELHAHLGREMLPWAVGLFAVALAQWAWFHFFAGKGRFAGRLTSRALRTAITIVLIAGVAVAVVGSCYTVYMIGDSGARATWSNKLTGTSGG